MGGFFHLDFNENNMARKIFAHMQRVDGLEAPRNSLELQVEASQSCCTTGRDGLYSFHVEEDWSENNCYAIEASMKRLINEEISKQPNTRKNSPSIVARLMGVDMFPLDAKSAVQPIDRKKESPDIKSFKKEKNERSSATRLPCKSKSTGQMEFDSFYLNKERDAYRWSNDQMSGKPRPREHPQEEELQKFKKEFEAWQAARFSECSKFVDYGNTPGKLFDQENDNKPKMIVDENTVFPTKERPVKQKGLAVKASSHEQDGWQNHRGKVEPLPPLEKQFFSSRNRTESLVNYDRKLDNSAAPTSIVILKPGPDRIYDQEESWTSSSSTLEDRGTMEDFLEEVRERLKFELQGKTLKKGSIVRGSGIETPFSEKPSDPKLSDPKQIAKNIAKHVRDGVTHDLGMNLLRSESTRSYRSEVQYNGLGSSEFINRDTRRFLSERLRNVVKREPHVEVPMFVNRNFIPSCLHQEKVRINQGEDASTAGNELSYWEIVKDEQEMQTESFRQDGDDGLLYRDLSPRNLVRSLSAPVSGTSFGKLLLEDRHVLTGAQIRRKHEMPENIKVKLKKHRKDKLNIKERVSNLRYSFNLREKLFGKKIQSVMASHRAEQNFAKDIMSGPTALMNFGGRRIMENSTEVPPSPASVCSSTQDELWRAADYPSPASTPDITLEDDKGMPQVFREISSNLNELRRQLNQLESDEPDLATTEEPIAMEATMTDDIIEDNAEAYIRDLLVASGLYSGSCYKYLSTLAKPINDSIFEEVEESSRKLGMDTETATKDHNDKKADRKMLFDLLNEVLSTSLRPPLNKARFSRKNIAFSVQPRLRGRKLLDNVWEKICEYLYPANDKSCYLLENMVGRNLSLNPWWEWIDDEMNELGKEIECQIIGDVLEEIVNDVICP